MTTSVPSADAGIYCDLTYAEADSEKVIRPVDVRASILHITVSDYDDRSAIAIVSYQVNVSWIDPRLEGWPEDSVLPADLWLPPLFCYGTNTPEDEARIESGLWKQRGSLAFVPGGRATGELFLVTEITDEEVPCKYSTDLRDFPLDSHDRRDPGVQPHSGPRRWAATSTRCSIRARGKRSSARQVRAIRATASG